MAKTAAELLIDYGYSEVQKGLFVPARPSSERWEKVEGGWHCYSAPTAGFGGGQPWGRVLEGGALMQVPFTQKAEFTNLSGAHPASLPDVFEWVWPEERLVEIYGHAPLKGEGNQFVKVSKDDGSHTIARAKE